MHKLSLERPRATGHSFCVAFCISWGWKSMSLRIPIVPKDLKIIRFFCQYLFLILVILNYFFFFNRSEKQGNYKKGCDADDPNLELLGKCIFSPVPGHPNESLRVIRPYYLLHGTSVIPWLNEKVCDYGEPKGVEKRREKI